MFTRITAAVFVFLAFTAPARATMVDPPFQWYQIDTLNLTYPNNTTLTGNLYIQDGAPSVGTYIAGTGLSSLSVNGTPQILITSGTGYLYALGNSITFFVPPPGSPGAPTPYGETPLYLSVPNIFLDGVPAHGGTISTQFCRRRECLSHARSNKVFTKYTKALNPSLLRSIPGEFPESNVMRF
jgi:hypothetical protein